jgi:hypothetical protein
MTVSGTLKSSFATDIRLFVSGYPRKEAKEQRHVRARVAYANVISEGTRGGTGAIRERTGEVGGKETEVPN